MTDGSLFNNWEIVWTGAVAGVLAAIVLFYFPWCRARWRYIIAGVAISGAWIGWNFVLDSRHASSLTVDTTAFDLSWQNLGSGIFGFAAVVLALNFREYNQPTARVVGTAFIAGAVAFVWNIFVL